MVSARPPEGRTVLVTVGTTKFDGLVAVIDTLEFQLRLQGLGYESIVYQIGTGRRIPSTSLLKLAVYDYLNNFCEFIERADLIISHGGAGTLLDVSKYRKPVIFVANEDTSENHQRELMRMLDPEYSATLETLIDRLENPRIAPEDPFARLLPGDKFRELISDLMNSV